MSSKERSAICGRIDCLKSMNPAAALGTSARKLSWGRVLVLCIVGLLLVFATEARAERRVALIIGNSHYRDSSLTLTNPVNDARDVAKAFRELGFDVIETIDADRQVLDRSMANFARAATNADTALFYYAGHAIQYQGRNYLMPIDAEIQDEVSLRFQLVAVDDVRTALDRTNGVKILILDSCRNNPIADMLQRRAGEKRGIQSRGLARMDKTQGMVVAYSTSPDDVAADGTGRNSPFTASLLKWLKQPGLEIEKLFRRIASDVNASTDGRQRPETYVSLLSDFYLNQLDRDAYEQIKDTSDPAMLKSFVQRYPDSVYVTAVKTRLQALEMATQEQKLREARLEDAARLAAEKQRADAVQRLLDEQLAKMIAERQRVDGERRQREEQALKQAAPEPQRPDARPTAQPDTQAARAAASEPAKQIVPQLKAAAPAVETTIASRDPPTPTPPVPANCDKDQERLARLRSDLSRDAIDQFEREMTCERLRPQLARLRESLPAPSDSLPNSQAPSNPPAAANASPPSPPVVNEVKQTANAQQSINQDDACKRDASRLAELRAKPVASDIAEFDRTLACSKLRPQLSRLKESVAFAAPDGSRGIENSARAPSPASQADAPLSVPALSCDQEASQLSQLRNHGTRELVQQFQDRLSCDKLRPQVSRLLESLGG
ncbi:caspase family protein [Bradyrhizobium genosp. A]|uniref:caspase family protein n=1 Tax=Bradyrhizobium genosp. A TaxID=83626 RepID=UPI003CEF8338